MFSSRLPHPMARNRLWSAVERRKSAGLPIVDLTLSNPTKAGFTYPSSLLALIADRRGLCYEPDPFGLASAREAIAGEVARCGVSIPANQIILTASTSEAYSLLFKLLCDPGDVVIAPRPSYPLFEHLTALDAVVLEHYTLECHGRWAIDVRDLEEKLGSGKVRAIMMVSPNNPTGSIVADAELDAVSDLACRYDAALIGDEVFADYAMSGAEPVSILRNRAALTFALGGLSKAVGLPQLKLGWIAVGGPARLVTEALDRLETICDAYLSVSTPVQLAAPALLRDGAAVRGQIQRRVRENRARLLEIASGYADCSVMPAEGGWYSVVRVPAVQPEESIVLDLLDRTGVLVHPGYFFDFDREAFLIVSLLPERSLFDDGMQAVFAVAGASR